MEEAQLIAHGCCDQPENSEGVSTASMVLSLAFGCALLFLAAFVGSGSGNRTRGHRRASFRDDRAGGRNTVYLDDLSRKCRLH